MTIFKVAISASPVKLNLHFTHNPTKEQIYTAIESWSQPTQLTNEVYNRIKTLLLHAVADSQVEQLEVIQNG